MQHSLTCQLQGLAELAPSTPGCSLGPARAGLAVLSVRVENGGGGARKRLRAVLQAEGSLTAHNSESQHEGLEMRSWKLYICLPPSLTSGTVSETRVAWGKIVLALWNFAF